MERKLINEEYIDEEIMRATDEKTFKELIDFAKNKEKLKIIQKIKKYNV